MRQFKTLKETESVRNNLEVEIVKPQKVLVEIDFKKRKW
jgi:hypothetical protein